MPGVSRWFTVGENIVTYKNLDDLRTKVGHYLSHDSDRQVIAERSQFHVYEHHTYDKRAVRFEELVASINEV